MQRKSIFRLLLLWAATATLATAQIVTGSMIGTVKDASGGLVAHAAIKIENENTGGSRSVTSDGKGTFLVTNLPVGTYTLTASATGFSPYTMHGIVLEVAQQARIDVPLA